MKVKLEPQISIKFHVMICKSSTPIKMTYGIHIQKQSVFLSEKQAIQERASRCASGRQKLAAKTNENLCGNTERIMRKVRKLLRQVVNPQYHCSCTLMRKEFTSSGLKENITKMDVSPYLSGHCDFWLFQIFK